MKERTYEQSPKDPGDTVIDHIQTNWIKQRPAHIRKRLERLTDDDWEKVLLTVTACAERRAKGKRGLWKRDNKTARTKAKAKKRAEIEKLTRPCIDYIYTDPYKNKHLWQAASRGGKQSRKVKA